jgi:rhodanese-related sulfurtransferase
VPYDQVEASTDKLPADKTAKIVVYCRSGAMSAIAARSLVKLGYTNVWDLTGGMGAWQDAGYPLIDKIRQ